MTPLQKVTGYLSSFMIPMVAQMAASRYIRRYMKEKATKEFNRTELVDFGIWLSERFKEEKIYAPQIIEQTPAAFRNIAEQD